MSKLTKRKLLPKDRYLVVSYNSEEQQFHYDFIRAVSAEEAKEQILMLRDYCIDADVTSVRELTNMGKRLGTIADRTIDGWIAELQQEAAGA